MEYIFKKQKFEKLKEETTNQIKAYLHFLP